MSTFYIVKNDNDLLHYGVLGMKWGIRRYQNKDGSLTAAGQKRYSETTKKDRRINSAKMAALGALTTGPIGQLKGTIAGQVVSNRTADAIIQRQKKLLSFELGAIGGFFLGDFINKKRIEAELGREYAEMQAANVFKSTFTNEDNIRLSRQVNDMYNRAERYLGIKIGEETRNAAIWNAGGWPKNF